MAALQYVEGVGRILCIKDEYLIKLSYHKIPFLGSEKFIYHNYITRKIKNQQTQTVIDVYLLTQQQKIKVSIKKELIKR